MLLISIIAASLAVSLVSLSGAALLLSKRFPLERLLVYLVSFAAGVMLAAAFLDLLPEALEAAEGNPAILTVTLLGVVLFFFLERFLLWFHHHDEPHGARPSTVLILVGDALHNFIDGVAIAAAFLINPVLGLTTTLAIAAHEIPQEIADLGVLLHGGLARHRALWYNWLSAITAILGAVAGYIFLGTLTAALPWFLAFAGGMFIYIACSDLIPDLHTAFKREKRWRSAIPLAFGILLFALLSRLLGE